MCRTMLRFVVLLFVLYSSSLGLSIHLEGMGHFLCRGECGTASHSESNHNVWRMMICTSMAYVDSWRFIIERGALISADCGVLIHSFMVVA